MTATQQCPNCGAQSSGKFCAECGSPLGERTCPHCGSKLSGKAKFCPECGGAVIPTLPGGARPLMAAPADKLPWIIAVVAVLALLTTLIVVVTRGRAPAAATQEVPGIGDPTRGTTDLTQLSPREAADRLFDRVARASEAGDTAQVNFFGPMTVQAYANVTPLDADARLHLGLVQLALGNHAAADAQADSIAREFRNHLFASLLRIRAAEQRGDAAGARRLYGSYLQSYDAERARRLPEYDQHDAILVEARNQARTLAGGS